MDRIGKLEAGDNIARAGLSSAIRMPQHQQNPGAHSNAPVHHPPPPPQPQQGHKCPRCGSSNTKFCYYNNYSSQQPRYFCKGCRRYWTQGGTLRNVPVGGGCRKGSKRAKTSTSASATASATASSHPQPPLGGVAPPTITTNTSYYPSVGGSFLSSLAAIQSSLGQPQLDLGGGSSSGMNMGFLQGLGILPPVSSHAQLFRGPPPLPPSSSNNEWITQGFVSNPSSDNDNPGSSIPAGSADSNSFWGENRTSGATNSAAAGDGDSAGGGLLMNPNQWLGLPRYGPPQ